MAYRAALNHRVVTHLVYPPIPIRDYDWVAFRDGWEESCVYGYGRTEEAAVAQLKEVEAEKLETEEE